MGAQRRVDQRVFGKLASVVVGDRLHAATKRVQRGDDRFARRACRAVLDADHLHIARPALDQRDQARRPFTDDAVGLPVTHLPTLFNVRRTLLNTPAVEALALARGADARLPPASTTAMRPQVTPGFSIGLNVLIDALGADRDLALGGNLLRAPIITQALLDLAPCGGVDAWTTAGDAAPYYGLSVGMRGPIAALADVALALTGDRAVMAFDQRGDLAAGEASLCRRSIG